MKRPAAKTRNFGIPDTLHLLSATNLNISSRDLNGTLGTFPINSRSTTGGGEQKIRELLIFTNDLTTLEHSNMVRYLIEKWNISLSHFATNLYSRYFEDYEDHVIENAVDNDVNTTFYLNYAEQRNFTNGEVLFESKIIGSVLNPFSWTNGTRGISQGDNILLLRTGYDDSRLSLKAEVKVQLLRQADVLAGNETWFTLTNIAANNLNEAKSLQFYLLDTSNDFIGYRLVANGTGGDNWGLEIDDFIPSLTRVTANSPRVLAFASSLFWDTIYNTNTLLFSNGFTNTLLFDQEVYGLQASDFEVSNGHYSLF